MIFRLPKDLVFPDPHLAEADGLLAIGGDLSPRRLLLAYSYGIFPWFSFRDCEEPLWFCPHERFVIFPDEIHISHSMRSLIRKGTYSVTFNSNFSAVIDSCSKLRYDEKGAWLGEDMAEAYTRLHNLGLAGSVEVWHDGHLVGGLYGVTFGRCFFGESMFSKEPSASKLALIALAKYYSAFEGSIIDCQLKTDHLESMGGRFISYDDFMSIVSKSHGRRSVFPNDMEAVL